MQQAIFPVALLLGGCAFTAPSLKEKGEVILYPHLEKAETQALISLDANSYADLSVAGSGYADRTATAAGFGLSGVDSKRFLYVTEYAGNRVQKLF